MTVETKFKGNELVWAIYDNKAQQIYLDGFIIKSQIPDFTGKIACQISYKIYDSKVTLSENQVFATKQELINSL